MGEEMKNKITFESPVNNGKIEGRIARHLNACIKNMDGKRVRIIIEECKRKRSLNQNAYYFGVVVQLVHGAMIDAGNDIDTEEVHNMLKVDVGRLVKDVVLPDGTKRKVIRSTTELSTVEFEEYLEKCRAWAAQFDLIIPLPHENVMYG